MQNDEVEPGQLAPDNEVEPGRLAPDNEVEPGRLAPDNEVEPGQLAPDNKVEPGQLAPDNKVEPGRLAPDNEVEPGRLAPDNKVEPGRLAPDNEVEPGQLAPDDKVEHRRFPLDGEGELRRLTLDDDGDLGYCDAGHGATILLVHAGVFSDWFRPLSQQLPRDRFRVVRVRRSGYRDTAPPSGHLTLADHARHAARLLDDLGTGPVHWVGHSSSCLIGLQLAQDRPDLVASLSLLEPAPGGDLHGPADEQFVAATVRPAMEAFFRGDPAGAFDRFMRGIGGPGYPAVINGELGPGSVEAARAESAFFFADEVRAVREWVFGPGQAVRVTQPALVVLGADSARVIPLMVETVQRLSAMLPNARTQTLPGCSHMLPLEQPAALARLITGFIDTIPTASNAGAVSP